MRAATTTTKRAMRAFLPGLLVVGLAAALAACPIDVERLPGAPCDSTDDCGAGFSCARVPGREETVCIPGAEEQVVGCAGAADGDDCADGDACTEGDRCDGGVCRGTPKSCDVGESCVSGLCLEAVCDAAPAQVAVDTGNAAAPRLAYNPDDDELGVAFEAPVLDRIEVFFVRIGGNGVPKSGLVQLTDGTPPTADDPAISSTIRDVAWSPEERRFGVLFEDDFLGGLQFTTLTADAQPAGGSARIAASLNLLGLFGRPAQMDWNGERFVFGYLDVGDNDVFDVFFDSVQADGDGASFLSLQLTHSADAGDVDIAANGADGEVGLAYAKAEGGGVHFVRATDDGTALDDVPLSALDGAPRSPAIAHGASGFLIAWQETVGEVEQIVCASVDDSGAVLGGPTLIATPGALPDVTATASGFAIAWLTLDGSVGTAVQHVDAQAHKVGAPIQVKSGMVSSFAPTCADAGGGAVAVAWGPLAAQGDAGGDVEVARACP